MSLASGLMVQETTGRRRFPVAVSDICFAMVIYDLGIQK